jgi:trehalose synthase
MTLERTSDLWWKNCVVYCLDVETFLDSDDDGHGDFAGLTERLDYLAGMGVRCLWLMPFYPSPNRDDGYDITDFYAVEPRLGSLGDFVAFVRTAKDRGMRIIVDLVVNHTSDRHPWFRNSRAGRNAPHRDWYVWADEPLEEPDTEVVFPDAEDSIWTEDERSGQWYLHHFYAHQPDLNIGNPAVREEIVKIAGFWLELGVDGFRVDAVPFLIETGGTAAGGDIGLDPHELVRDLRSFTSRRNGQSLLLGEVNLPADDLVAFFGDDDEFQLLFDFPLMQAMYLSLARNDAGPIRQALAARPELPEDSHWAVFVRNHDELTLDQLDDAERAEVFEAFGPDENMQLYGRGLRRRLPPMLGGDPARVRLVYSLLFSLPGTQVLFYGEEIGMGENLDIEGRLSVRTPMQWTSGRNAGFSTAPPARLTRPIPDGEFGPLAVNVADQRRADDSLLNWMERVVRRRNETPAFGWGTVETLDTSDDGVLAHRCDWEGEAVIAVHNLDPSALEVTVDLGETEDRDQLFDLLDPTQTNLSVERSTVSLKLAGYGHHWYRLVGADEVPAP